MNNENLHELFYEELSGDDTITQEMFEQIYALDPDTPLFINDYDVLSEEITAIVCTRINRHQKSTIQLSLKEHISMCIICVFVFRNMRLCQKMNYI